MRSCFHLFDLFLDFFNLQVFVKKKSRNSSISNRLSVDQDLDFAARVSSCCRVCYAVKMVIFHTMVVLLEDLAIVFMHMRRESSMNGWTMTWTKEVGRMTLSLMWMKPRLDA